MLKENLPELLQEVPLVLSRNMYFMHDGAPPHFGTQVRRFLDTAYTWQWIGRHIPIKWPPRSPDLTPCVFFMGEYKRMVYKTGKQQSRKQLIKKIQEAC